MRRLSGRDGEEPRSVACGSTTVCSRGYGNFVHSARSASALGSQRLWLCLGVMVPLGGGEVNDVEPTAASAVAAGLGLSLTGLDVPVGLSCSPITVAGDNCRSTSVTCDPPEAAWGGLIAINCIPITA
ncbi:hypothetical protein B0H10DRAFT_2223949 [Mycena sp. CBHHK59/15]|nr:hypothetical protein B0H10DRAFT_2223949 [Mycena sp. CBHHK59/15]